MLIKNIQTNQEPFILHMHNLRIKEIKNKFDFILNKMKEQSLQQSTEKDLTIITTTNFHEECPLSIILNKMNHKNFFVLGQEIKNWDFICKVKLLKNFLPTLKTNYVLFCDSHDVIPFKLNGIIEKFQSMNCKAIFNAEYFFWPDIFKYKKYNKIDIPNFILCEKKEFEMAPENLPPFLNSGVWLSSKEYANYMLNLLPIDFFEKHVFEHSKKICPNDQPYFREIFHLTYPETQLDYYSQLFQTYAGYKWNPITNQQEKTIDLNQIVQFTLPIAKEIKML